MRLSRTTAPAAESASLLLPPNATARSNGSERALAVAPAVASGPSLNSQTNA